jgi:signal peptidase I
MPSIKPTMQDESLLPMRRNDETRGQKRWWHYGCIGGIVLLILVFVATFIGEVRWVPTSSMENTIKAKSLVWMDKFTYGARLPQRVSDVPIVKYIFFLVPYLYPHDLNCNWGYGRMPGLHQPRRGDVIVFDSPCGDSTLFCKRLIGLPGDTVEIRHGVAFVNGSRLPLPRTVLPTIEADTIYTVSYPAGTKWNTHHYGPLVIPSCTEERYYFVLGDNRRNSCDSRVWGLVKYKDIVGRIIP